MAPARSSARSRSRSRRHVAFATAAIALGGALAVPLACLGGAGCVDLFHTTSFATLCDVDADAPGCAAPRDAGPAASDAAAEADAPFDYCAADADTQRQAAIHACAWLGACAPSSEDAAFDACIIHAMLAYDCNASTGANQNRQVRGRAREAWNCLAGVTTCENVMTCLVPDGNQPCSRAPVGFSGPRYAICAGGDGGAFARNVGVRVVCDADGGPPLAIESCVLEGRTCTADNGVAACAAPGAIGCYDGPRCDGDVLRDCSAGDGGVDRGADCTLVGQGKCVTSDAGAAACLANGKSGGCVASPAVSCGQAAADAGDVAIGCPSGIVETVDCARLLGFAPVPSGTRRCDAQSGGDTPWDVARACTTSLPCTPGCNGDGAFVGCARGVTVPVDCARLGLGACHAQGDAGFACAPP